MHHLSSAIVIGNGESRNCLDLKTYLGKITLIGCNAIHRDLLVDHLVCCDNRMVHETVSRKKSHKISKIYTRQRYFKDFNKLYDNSRVQLLPPLPYEGSLKPDQPEHWGSGPYALLLAVHLNFSTVHMVGFDLYGKNFLVNNVYKNTPNYLTENKPAVDPAYWIYQIRKIFVYYPLTNFKIYNTSDWKLPDDWVLPNVEYIDLNKFNIGIANEINTLYT